MIQNLAEVFSYFNIEWLDDDQSIFVNCASNLNRIHSLQEIPVLGMCCSISGELSISIEVKNLLSPKQIILLEEIFENFFDISQVIIKQVSTTQISEKSQHEFLSQAEIWIKRHANKYEGLESSLFALGKAETKGNKLTWHMQNNHYTLISQNEINWLQQFWDKFGPFNSKIRINPVNEQSSEELIENTEKLFLEANTISSELYQEKIVQIEEIKQENANSKAVEKNNGNRFRKKHRVSENVLWGRTGPEIPMIKLSDINHETDRALFEGQVFSYETKITRNGSLLVKFAITDLTTSISCILFADPEEKDHLTKIIKNNYLKVTANISYDDRYAKDFVARVTCIESAIKPQGRSDDSLEKRVELHMHSKLSAKDGTISPADIVKTASKFGHQAVAITDHGVVQAFPDIAATADELAKAGKPIKIIYGLEGYLLDDGFDCFAFKVEDVSLTADFIIFKLNVSGKDPQTDYIKEITALKFSYQGEEKTEAENTNNSVNNLDETNSIPQTENYTDQQLNSSAKINPEDYLLADSFYATLDIDNDENIEILKKFSEFCKGSILISENALLQLNFLRYAGFNVEESEPRVKFNPPLIDLRQMQKAVEKYSKEPIKFSPNSKVILTSKKKELSMIRSEDFINLKEFAVKFILLLQKANINQLTELNTKFSDYESFKELKKQRKKTNHILLLAKDSLGLYNMYRMCSLAHIDYFYYSPRIPRSLLTYYGTGIIKGMACVDGELFQNILKIYNDCNGDYEQAKKKLNNPNLLKIAKYYDFLEVQPLTNNSFLIRKEDNCIDSKQDLQNLNRLVLELGEITNMPVCATGDVHYLNPEDAIYRKILMTNMNFDDMEEMAELYFRTTEEMLAEFSYLESDLAHKIVIENPNEIADSVANKIRPFPEGSFPPDIKSADQNIKELTLKNAMAIYGFEGQLPEIVSARIERELSSIISNGFAVMYYISHLVVKKSNEDGYIVGSRGSVGSSLVATLCEITEVNPLQPHYVCPNCKYSEFDDSGDYGSGFDLPEKNCPKCGTVFGRDGQDIPFETFLGFYGDKQPDIDLNFSGFYQARAHQYIEDMFGTKQTYRAGTISSYAEKNSAGMVLNYFEEQERPVSQTEVTRLSQGLQGVKVTTGQHPGGMVVIPKDRDIFDFTPVQYPANKKESGVITTHFDFNSLQETILKLDILGHDDPSMLKMLGDITGIDVTKIPIPDEKVMSLFHSTEALGIPDEESTIKSATIGLPELGTFLVRSMIAETKPTQFYDLVQISGLSHGTDVWTGNAQELIRDGTCTINDVIGCRDSIMTYLIYRGLPNKSAFDIMEKVRKGRGLSEDDEKLMRKHDVPEWYIESCKKIKYMFPKAHAVAYLISALRIAWFKVYYPEAYYCAFFTIRATEFSSDELCLAPNIIKQKRAEQRRNWNDLTAQQQKRHFYLELVEEMQARNIDFLPFDLEKCEATVFYSPEKGKIRPALNAIPNISDALAKQIVEARKNGGEFKTQEELSRRAQLGPAAMEALASTGMLDDIPESAQIDLFSLL